jgi:rhamnosyltransferase
MKFVIAIIVSYCPEASSFIELLRKLEPQVSELLIVDNSPSENNDTEGFIKKSKVCLDRVSLFRLEENLGLATALNIGIREAMARSADFVLLSDQDSLPEEGMVMNLCRAYDALIAGGGRVAAIGPTYTDLYTGLTYPFQVKLPEHFFYKHKVPTPESPHVETLTLITSGSLIPIQVFHDVGLMREDFFIDQVDIEWCHRAQWKGYHLYGTVWARMSQRMGEHRLHIWFLRWRYESAYNPLRIYYRTRNFVALWKADFIEWRWKIRSSWYLLGIVYAHVLFGNQPFATLKMFAKGVWHGLRVKMGRYSE